MSGARARTSRKAAVKNRTRAVVQAVGGLVVSLLLLVGVPVLLVRLAGNPFPSSVPPLDEIVETLTQSGSGFSDFIINGLAILLWLLWFQVVIAFCVELFATMRRRQTRRLPTLPGIQSLAARLVASMTLATTLAAAPVLAPAVGALSFDPIEPTVLVSQPTPPTQGSPLVVRSGDETATTAQAPEVAPGQTMSVRVAEPTELWDLAEAVYGDGVAWKIIARANAGTAAADGVMITTATEMVAANTVLTLIDVADGVDVGSFGDVIDHDHDPANDLAGADSASTLSSIVLDPTLPAFADAFADEPMPALANDALHTVEAGDTLWSMAEDVVEQRHGGDVDEQDVAPYWADVVDANRHRVASGDVDLIYPGEELVLPNASSEMASAPEAASEPPASEQLAAEVDQPFVATGVTAEPGIPMLAEVSDAAHVGASAQASTDMTIEPSIDRAHASGLAKVTDAVEASSSTPRSPSDSGVPAAPIGLAAFGSALLAAGFVGALRHRRALQRRQRPPGEFPHQPSSPAAAFEAALVHSAASVIESKHGAGWRMLPASAVGAVLDLGHHELHLDPTGEMIATALTDDATVSVSVDLAPTLAHDPNDVDDGDDEPVYASASIVVGTDVATGTAVLLDLGTAGAIEVQGDLERVRFADSFADALAKTVRCGHSGSSRTPVVVIASDAPPDDDSMAALRELGALVLAPGIDAEVRVAITGNRASIWPNGSTVVLAALNSDDYAASAELVECTAADATDPVDPGGTLGREAEIAIARECSVVKGAIEVQVLGPVTVEGAAPFSSLKATDVIAYLAFHRNGADADQIKSWVWPTYEPPSDKAFANVMSRARTGLGATEGGDPYLSRAGGDKTYRLADDITTDFDRFRAIVELADTATNDDQALEYLRQALELIRGVPFSGGSASSFAWADNHVRAHVEFTIDEAVHRCADLALELGELEVARWAARKGLELVPGCEQCFRRRFLVAGADQNRNELRRAMADLEKSAAADLGEPEAVDAISHDLLDLYEQLDRELVAGAR